MKVIKYIVLVLVLAVVGVVGLTWEAFTQTGITTFQVGQDFVNNVNAALAKLNGLPFNGATVVNNINMGGAYRVINEPCPSASGDVLSEGCPAGAIAPLTGLNVTNATFTNGTGNTLSGLNGAAEGALNATDFGYKPDARSAPACTLTAANPGTISACGAINFAQTDVGHPFRAIWPAANGSNIAGSGTGNLTPCIASVVDSADATYGVITHWLASASISLNAIIEDSNGNTETATVGGTTGTVSPAWPTALNGTVVDNGVTWTLTAFGSTGACASAAYTGSTESSVYIQTGTDNLWPLMNTLLGAGDKVHVHPLRVYIPKGSAFINDTWDIQRRSGEVLGQGGFANNTSTPSSSQLIWVGPRGHAPIRMRGDIGLWVHDIDIATNSSPNNKPSAGCVDFLQDGELNAFNRVSRVNCSLQNADVDNGNVGGTNLAIVKKATFGFLWNPDSTGQNDRITIDHVSADRVESCFFVGQGQVDTNRIESSTCGVGHDVCFEDVVGGNWSGDSNSCLGDDLRFDVGGLGGGDFTTTAPQALKSWAGEEPPFAMRTARFNGGYNLKLGETAEYIAVSGSHSPDNGIAIDTSGSDILPVYPGNSTVVATGQLIQLAPNWPDWQASITAALPINEAWWPSSPYGDRTLIKPTNNNGNGNYFQVTIKGVPAQSGPGITGLTEPNWDSSCSTIGSTCTDSQTGHTGITWVNYGPFHPQYVIVPTIANPGGYAFLLTTAGITGTVPPAWNQSVGGTSTDNTAVWTNIGVLPTNPGLFVYEATGGGTTGATPPASFSQVLAGTTTDGSVTWTTIYGGYSDGFPASTNTSTTTALTLSGTRLVAGSGATGDPTTLPEVYAAVTPSSSAAQVPIVSLRAPGVWGFGQTKILRVRRGADTSNTTNRQTQVVMTRPPSGSVNSTGEVTEEFEKSTSPLSFRHDLNGKVNVVGGPLTMMPIAAPATPSTMTCVVPDWAASRQVGNKWVIRPTVGNAGNYFFQNETGSAFTTGATEPVAWNQTPGGTTADNGHNWTNQGDGSGVASAGAAGKAYIKTTWRSGYSSTAASNVPGETIGSAENTANCAPTDAQATVGVTGIEQAAQGADSLGVYSALSTGNEVLSLITPVDNPNGSSFFIPMSQVGALPFVASAIHQRDDVMLPVNNNVGNFVFVQQNPWCASAGSEATWNQTGLSSTTDGECSWLNIGTGAVPSVNTTGRILMKGITSGVVSQAVQPAAGTWEWDWPTSAGVLGQVIESGGGSGTPIRYGNQATWWSGVSASVASGPGTDYIGFGENAAQAVIATQANVMNLAPMSGTAYNLRCYVTTACQAGGVVFTVYGGAAGTTAEALTCTCTNVNTPLCSDTADTFAVAASDLLSVKVVNSNAANATGVTGCSFVIH